MKNPNQGVLEQHGLTEEDMRRGHTKMDLTHQNNRQDVDQSHARNMPDSADIGFLGRRTWNRRFG